MEIIDHRPPQVAGVRAHLISLLKSEEQMTYAEMGAKIGVSRQRVHQLCAELGLAKEPDLKKRARRQKEKELFDSYCVGEVDMPVVEKALGLSNLEVVSLFAKFSWQIEFIAEVENARSVRKRKEKDLFDRYCSGEIDMPEIEKALGLNDRQVRDLFRRRGFHKNWRHVESQHRLHKFKNKSFGKWTVIGVPDQPFSAGWRNLRLDCRCSCGVERSVLVHNIENNYSLGCNSCAAKTRQQVPWKRDDGVTFTTMSAAAEDAGVSIPTLSVHKRRNGAKPFPGTNGHTYWPVLSN